MFYIIAYFSTRTRPVTLDEAKIFWNSLTDAEKVFYDRETCIEHAIRHASGSLILTDDIIQRDSFKKYRDPNGRKILATGYSSNEVHPWSIRM